MRKVAGGGTYKEWANAQKAQSASKLSKDYLRISI